MMKKLILPLTLMALLASCIPDSVKEKMNEGMMAGNKIFADQEFKRAISYIELHKLRNGNYPNALSELRFLATMDSAMLDYVEYTRLDSVYELNLKFEFPSLNGEGNKTVQLKYPPEFWKGLGCVKSNAR
ncbi:MAG TPA: hypothetical protein VIU12_09260 [Chryseolinea sp.]